MVGEWVLERSCYAAPVHLSTALAEFNGVISPAPSLVSYRLPVFDHHQRVWKPNNNPFLVFDFFLPSARFVWPVMISVAPYSHKSVLFDFIAC